MDRLADKKRATAVAATTKVREATLALIMRDPPSTSPKDRPYPCTLCEKRFLSKSHYNEHQRVHTGERPFPCMQCERSFTTQHNLKRHQIIHTKEASYRCRKCGVLFCHVHKNSAADVSPAKAKPRRKAAKSAPAPLASSEPANAKKKGGQGSSPSKPAKQASKQSKGAEAGTVTFRRHGGGLQSKIAYDIEVVL